MNMSEWSTPEKDTPKGKLKKRILDSIDSIRTGNHSVESQMAWMTEIKLLLDDLYELGQNETNTCCVCDDACKGDFCERHSKEI